MCSLFWVNLHNSYKDSNIRPLFKQAAMFLVLLHDFKCFILLAINAGIIKRGKWGRVMRGFESFEFQ